MTSPQRTVPSGFEVEYYAGSRGEEYPLAVIKDGRRLLVAAVKERKRIFDPATGTLRETFVCRLEDGEVLTVERIV